MLCPDVIICLNYIFRLVTLLEELLLLKEYEKRETALLSRVGSKRSELADINGKVLSMIT